MDDDDNANSNCSFLNLLTFFLFFYPIIIQEKRKQNKKKIQYNEALRVRTQNGPRLKSHAGEKKKKDEKS